MSREFVTLASTTQNSTTTLFTNFCLYIDVVVFLPTKLCVKFEWFTVNAIPEIRTGCKISFLPLYPDHLGVRNFPRWRPAAILDLMRPEVTPFDPPTPKSRKPHHSTTHEVDRSRTTRCRDMAIRNFSTWRPAPPRNEIRNLVT